jgi:endonuclease/exonuclease/phosphatase family metal-dependent hydrolase
MTDDPNEAKLDKTAYNLAQACQTQDCIGNVAQTIDNVDTDWDIVALQEATNNSVLTQRSVQLQNMFACVGKAGHEEITTFINKTRFTVIKCMTGDLGDHSSSGKFKPNAGRAFQILYLKLKSTGSGLLLLNMHMGQHHGIDRNTVITRTSQTLSTALDSMMLDPNLDTNVIVASL